ncbi:hypothetical protein RAH57_03650 [Chryseobacterium sp. CKR4-1]|uniref:terpene synthase family protein n=1 Tax=Chryseobacterium sp. CKR4-1 TaxID=3068896 RepID=UPI002796ACB5|nr:hypothetical protein [Chryseobacterium sp. CKR4-1]MDQ1803065.1 hypothetical protein [Chryseobacterium sp. CKR4-1]
MLVTLPRIYCPYNGTINPLVHLAEDHTDAWLRQFNLLPDNTAYKKYRAQGFAYMVARMFPMAQQPLLFVLTDINSLLFLLDDQIDPVSKDEGRDKLQLRPFISAFMSVLFNPLPQKYAHPFLSALADFWSRATAITTDLWQWQFATALCQTFHSALWQMENVKNGYKPTLEEYKMHRRFLGAANIATASIPAVLDINGNWGRLTQQVADLTRLAENIVCWANDLYSLTKEIEQGDTYNLVLIIQQVYNLSLDEAINKTVGIHDQDMKRFQIKADALIGNLPSLTHYINGLKYIIRGNVDWSQSETTRYEFTYAQ